MDTASPASPLVVVHLVHGTWPYGWRAGGFRRRLLHGLSSNRCRQRLLRERFWFQPGSAFRKEVAAITGAGLKFVPFRWSGDNSFRARDAAATRFLQHLRIWHARWPSARHLIVAHSHGGTVAVRAIGDPTLTERVPVDGLLTMATPFVSLHGSLQSEDLLRTAAAALSPLSLAAAILTVIFCVLGGPITFLNSLLFFAAFEVVILFIVFWLVGLIETFSKGWFDRHFNTWFERLGFAGHEKPFTPRLSCALTAIRAPDDEASLAIAAAAAERLASRTWGMIGTWLTRWTVWISQSPMLYWGFLVILTLGGVLISIIFGLRITVFMVLVILIMASAVALIAPLILLFPTCLMLAVACGPEVLWFPGALGVYAEPVPNGVTAEVSILDLSDEDRRTLRLVHSLHVLPSAREKVAK